MSGMSDMWLSLIYADANVMQILQIPCWLILNLLKHFTVLPHVLDYIYGKNTPLHVCIDCIEIVVYYFVKNKLSTICSVQER